MTNSSEFFSRLVAGFGAVAITVSLLAASFSTPQASIFTGILA